LKKLNLPQLWETKIEQIIHENRLLYEPWLESATDYNELRDRLKGRGFTGVPMGPNPLLNMPAAKTPKADTSSCQIKRTMLRKKKSR
jgi:hypothetical protein